MKRSYSRVLTRTPRTFPQVFSLVRESQMEARPSPLREKVASGSIPPKIDLHRDGRHRWDPPRRPVGLSDDCTPARASCSSLDQNSVTRALGGVNRPTHDPDRTDLKRVPTPVDLPGRNLSDARDWAPFRAWPHPPLGLTLGQRRHPARRPLRRHERSTVGSVIKKRRKRMAKKKHRKLLKKTRVQRRRLGK
jgi:hypothetical protein